MNLASSCKTFMNNSLKKEIIVTSEFKAGCLIFTTLMSLHKLAGSPSRSEMSRFTVSLEGSDV